VAFTVGFETLQTGHFGQALFDGTQDVGEPAFPLTGTAQFGFEAEGAKLFTDLNEMIGKGYELAGAAGVDEIMLIGGAQLYATLLPRCDRLYVTRVDASVEGDAVFPAIDLDEWALTQSEGPQKGPKDQFSFDVAVFDRQKPGSGNNGGKGGGNSPWGNGGGQRPNRPQRPNRDNVIQGFKSRTGGGGNGGKGGNNGQLPEFNIPRFKVTSKLQSCALVIISEPLVRACISNFQIRLSVRLFAM